MSEQLSAVKTLYEQMQGRHDALRKQLNRPLTLAEKILGAHLDDPSTLPKRRESYVDLRPDRVAMQDATAQMALLQFLHAGREQTAVPTTVHCDHLIQAQVGAQKDLLRAVDENEEIYDFLRAVSQKYGIGFWKPGAGIIHQVVLENYAFPGGLMIGTDSHTPNAGGLGMIAVGVGGADAVDVMAGQPWNLRWPGAIGVHLTGRLSGWTAAKDVILKLCTLLTVKGGTGHIVEFFGPGAESISCTGKGTICNMGAEHGATTSVFPFDASMAEYLRATERADLADLAEAHREALRADPEVLAHPGDFYDRVIEIDLSTLEPQIVGPHSPDRGRPVSKIAEEAQKEGYPTELSHALIGSCTNSSYEDIQRAASIVRSMTAAGRKLKTPLLVTPGSDQIMQTMIRDGLMECFESAGATVLANACGPCIGQWQRTDIPPGSKNSIVSSYNRNFRGRNDGNAETLSFIASPEVVVAMAYAGRLDFDPSTSTVDGQAIAAPSGPALPEAGYVDARDGFIPPAADGKSLSITVAPDSDRLQLLERFAPWDGKDFEGLVVLVKAKGKCTTDHISAAGKWLKYRGHLDNISNNLFLGAENAFTGAHGTAINVESGQTGSIPDVARAYKKAGLSWIAVGDENYGEGSSREHAAMEPRHLGARAVIARSFARIHETNLKKQGVLPLVFANPADYDKIQAKDRVSITGLRDLGPGSQVTVKLTHEDGTSESFPANHTLSEAQVQWFRAGSALNHIAAGN